MKNRKNKIIKSIFLLQYLWYNNHGNDLRKVGRLESSTDNPENDIY